MRWALAPTPVLQLTGLNGAWGSSPVLCESVVSFWLGFTCTANLRTGFVSEMYLQMVAQEAFPHRDNIMNNLGFYPPSVKSGILVPSIIIPTLFNPSYHFNSSNNPESSYWVKLGSEGKA